MFEFRIITADRAQVRKKKGLPDYEGNQWLNLTINSLLHSDIPLKRVTIYNDNLNFEYGEQSTEHLKVLDKARSLGIRIVQNNGGGFVKNSTEALSDPIRFEDTTHIVFFEDDIKIHKSMYKNGLAWVNGIPDLKFGLFFSRLNSNTVDPEHFSCTQAVVFNVDVINELVFACNNFEEVVCKPNNIPDETADTFDIKLAMCIKYIFKVPFYNCTPSLVQHIGSLESSWVLPNNIHGGDRSTQYFKK